MTCPSCGKNAGTGYLAQHVCASCGFPQPVPKAPVSYFEIFGIPKKFKPDLSELQRRFYELSRALHPDRFTQASEEARQNSLGRMSLMNEAYGILKDPGRLREYILEQEGIIQGKSQIPEELAESWFELQDVLADDPERAVPKIQEFEKSLGAISSRLESRIDVLGTQMDSTGFNQELLQELGRSMQRQSYLISLARDVDRMKKRFL